MKYVAWSGGFDSNYLVMKHVLNGETVQPIYSWIQPLADHHHQDARQLTSIEYFRSKYPNNILKPIMFGSQEFYYENKKNIDTLKNQLYDLENENKKHYLAQDGLIYTKIIDTENIFTLTNSKEITLDLKKNLRPTRISSIKQSSWNKILQRDMELLLKYYFPIFPKKEEWEYISGWQNFFLFPLIEFSNKMDIKIEMGFHQRDFIFIDQVKKWLGINEKMQIEDLRYKQLQNLLFPLHNKTKFEMAKDFIEMDSALFEDVVDNGASCISKTVINDSNYCFKCSSCYSMIKNRVFLLRNLHKLKS